MPAQRTYPTVDVHRTRTYLTLSRCTSSILGPSDLFTTPDWWIGLSGTQEMSDVEINTLINDGLRAPVGRVLVFTAQRRDDKTVAEAFSTGWANGFHVMNGYQDTHHLHFFSVLRNHVGSFRWENVRIHSDSRAQREAMNLPVTHTPEDVSAEQERQRQVLERAGLTNIYMTRGVSPGPAMVEVPTTIEEPSVGESTRRYRTVITRETLAQNGWYLAPSETNSRTIYWSPTNRDSSTSGGNSSDRVTASDIQRQQSVEPSSNSSRTERYLRDWAIRPAEYTPYMYFEDAPNNHRNQE